MRHSLQILAHISESPLSLAKTGNRLNVIKFSSEFDINQSLLLLNSGQNLIVTELNIVEFENEIAALAKVDSPVAIQKIESGKWQLSLFKLSINK